jgi:hypothetical protein
MLRVSSELCEIQFCSDSCTKGAKMQSTTTTSSFLSLCRWSELVFLCLHHLIKTYFVMITPSRETRC